MQNVHSMHEMAFVIVAITFAVLAVIVPMRKFLYDLAGPFGRRGVIRSLWTVIIAWFFSVALLVSGYYEEAELTDLISPYPGSKLYNMDFSDGKRQWMYISPGTKEEILTYYAELANRPSRKAERVSKDELELYIRGRRFKIMVNTIPFKQLRFLVVEEIRKTS